MQFADLQLSEPILRAVATEGYSIATPIQAQAIPPALLGKDVLGCAQTGTGKTAAFALPILQKLFTHPHVPGAPRHARALILCPTRELATQISDSFRAYGKNVGLRQTVVFGGVNQRPQADSLRHGTDVIIATPGRLIDLLNQGLVDLRHIQTLVLDEADRMLDMGFIHDIRRIVAKLPTARQTMFFSATMPNDIRKLADTLLRDPVTVQVAPQATTADGVEQCVYFVERGNKPALLAHLVESVPMSRAIVFTRTKHGADRVVRHLVKSGIRCESIHGNKSQNARERAMKNFRNGKIPVLVATDIASRGIDIDDITHVVNYDLTHEPETYVHRIGRTARAGATGQAISLVSSDETGNLKAIERLLRKSIPVRNDHPVYSKSAAAHDEPSHPRERRHRQPERSSHAPRQSHDPRPRPHAHAASTAPRRHENPSRNPHPASRLETDPQRKSASPKPHRAAPPRAQHPLHRKGRGVAAAH
jgi:ATP-dependent RNA helicase RhlE